jgi:Tfp pilus assembly protein PilX
VRSLNEEGFSLVTAILAILILTALGILALTVSSQDIRISSQTVGSKKAASAAEAGIHELIKAMNADLPAVLTMANDETSYVVINSTSDSGSQYKYTRPARPSSGPTELPMVGYAIGGGQSWSQKIYVSTVTGVNTRYDSSVSVELGVGFGPVDSTPMSR